MTKNFKKTMAILLAILMIVSVLPMTVFGSQDGYYYYEVYDDEVYITDVGTSISGDITIPSTLGGYPVTSIGIGAFWGCTGLTTITIPNSVKSIGWGAFKDCTGLTTITIPNSVTSIGECAFEYCTGLTSITIPNSVTSIEYRAFRGCTGLTSITVDSNNQYYDSRNNCNAIIKTETNTLVVGCKNTVIPNSVKSIGSWAFNDCTGLTTITIPNSVTSIGSGAFEYCTDLTTITIPNSVKSIGSYAFEYCTGLTSITIPNSVTSIGWSAFENCTGLTSITIPNSVTSIGYGAFSYCTGLTSITIPNSVTSIGYGAFSYCTGLTSITVDSNNTKYDSRNNCNAIIETETNTLVVGCKNTVIPNSVTSIGEEAFRGCTGLTSITIPNSVTSIGDRVFWDCTGLTSITIPDSVTSIGWCAFNDTAYYNNSSNWENNVLYIGNHFIKAKTISGKYSIKTGTICIADDAFRGCTGLTSITIPNSVTSIGSWAFGDCTGLTSITIPNSVTSIGYYAFGDCTGLTSITIPNSVTSIGDWAFYDCTGLQSVIISDSVTSIDSYAFDGCSDLTTIYGFKDSEAERFANSKGIDFVVIGHQLGDWIYDEATKTHTRTCIAKNCTDSETENCTFDDGEVTQLPTCTSEGIKSFTCTVCNGTYTQAIKKVAHQDTQKVVPSTCTAKGYTLHTCSVCEGSYKDNYTEIIPHNFVFSYYKKSTCIQDGGNVSTCSVCGTQQFEPTESKTGHNYVDGTCTNCGDRCSCKCHKSGFPGFLWKISLFFYKLFGTHKTCSCGINHY